MARSESETLDVEAKSQPVVQPEPLVSEAETVVEQVAKPGAERMKAETATAAAPAPAAPEAEPLPRAPAEFPAALMSSGKPFTALEQIFVLTTGDGPATLKSELTVAMLSEAAGEKSEHILGKVPVDVIGGAAARVLETIRAGTIPDSVWRNLFKIKASIAQQIQDGMYHLCIRTFPVESEELVALFLLYNKQRL